MTDQTTRRAFIAAAPIAAVAGSALLAVRPARADTPTPGAGVHDAFPSQDPELARQAVAFSHGNIDGLRALLDDQPELAKAAWDWGFGDWETCLGAASHTGRVEIAELLLDLGARPTIFSAAMLGQIDIVRAFVEAQPGVQRTPGPHGITLLAHARAGGERAAPVAQYLESVGDADIAAPNEPLDPADRDRLTGAYAWGAGETDRLIVELRRNDLSIQRPGAPRRGLNHRGDLVFSPAGAPSVRIAFDTPDPGPAHSLHVRGAGVDLVARRVAD